MAERERPGDPETRIELLRREVRFLSEKLAQTEERVLELDQRNKDLRRKLRRIKEHPLGRVALALAAVLRPARVFARRLVSKKAREQAPKPKRVPAKAEQELVEVLVRQRTGAGVSTGPLVSIVVLTRNGLTHMQRLLSGLRDRTDYKPFEVIVVDNGSTDGTDELLAAPWPFPVRAIRNEENSSFSAGNNQGVAVAEGELVLLLNNDVDPINPNWLGAMVDTLLQRPEHGAVGALLVYPRRTPVDLRGDVTHPDLTVQHRGIAFRWADGAPRGRNLGGGEDPGDPALAEDRRVPGVTAAAMLLRRADLAAVGGLSEGYVYGAEDVDLCLKLRAAGKDVVLCGRAVLFHHEFGTQSQTQRDVKAHNRRNNARIFAGRWAPVLARTMRLDLFSGRSFWSGGRRPTIAITITQDDPTAGWGDWYTAHELGDALGERGWNVVYAEGHRNGWYQLGDDVDVVLVLLDRYDIRKAPPGALTVAWIRNWADRWIARPWFARFDVVATSSVRAGELAAASSGHDPVVLPIAANERRFRPVEPRPELACDYTITANNWGAGRRIIDWLDVRPGERFNLYGRGWEGVDGAAPYWRGHLEYERLPQLYSSAKIVIDDSAEHTRPYASVNSRVFEALATGALVVSNDVAGANEVFAGRLPTYSSPAELRAVLDRYLGDEALRRSTVEDLRRMVLERHTYAHRAEQVISMLTRVVEQPSVAIRICTPNDELADHWGDTHFARQFARSLRRLGFTVTIHMRGEWEKLDAQDADVVVHLLGVQMYMPKPGAINVLWVISHPDDLSPQECEAYDVVCVASGSFAARLREAIDVPVHVLHQATDTSRFRPVAPEDDLRSEVLFLGNSRKQHRPAVEWAVELGAPIQIWGADWEAFVPPELIRGSYFPNERLAALYSSARIVLNDHWPDMREHGFASNRIFDALASGAFVISDPVPGMDELFGEAVPTFDTKEALAELLRRYSNDDAERERLAKIGMERVHSMHSFDARAREFAAVIRPLIEARSATIDEAAARNR